MIDKILWASDGSKDSIETLKHAELLASRFKAHIVGLYVVPDYSKAILGKFSSDDENRFTKWLEATKSKQLEGLEIIAKNVKNKGIGFKSRTTDGVPHKEILKVADEEKADLIAMGKGRPIEKFILGGTALKVLRGSPVPVLTARDAKNNFNFKKILVPTDLSHRLSRDFNYALELSRSFNAVIYLLNVVEVGNYDFPMEIIELMKGFCSREIEENIGKVRTPENVEPCVVAAKNAWRGIVEFAEDKDIDLVVMMTHGGGRFKDDFIGSVAEKVIQEARCPVITMRP